MESSTQENDVYVWRYVVRTHSGACHK